MTIRIVYPGKPVTKKNHQRILKNRRTGQSFISQSNAYLAYEQQCIRNTPQHSRWKIDTPCRVTCVYYMPDKRRVDMTNLLAATHDILVKAGVLADDNSRIIQSVDGSRVEMDKAQPRVEVEVALLKYNMLNDKENADDRSSKGRAGGPEGI